MKKAVPAPRPSFKHRRTASNIQRDDIGEPSDFRHVAHVGWDYVDNISPDEDLQKKMNPAVKSDTSTVVRMPVGYSKGATQQINFDVDLNESPSSSPPKARLSRKVVTKRASSDQEYVSHPAFFQHLAHIEDTRSNEQNFVVPKAVGDRTIRSMFHVVDRNISTSANTSSSPRPDYQDNRAAVSSGSSAATSGRQIPTPDANRKAIIPPKAVAGEIAHFGFPSPPADLPKVVENNEADESRDLDHFSSRPESSRRIESEDSESPYMVPRIEKNGNVENIVQNAESGGKRVGGLVKGDRMYEDDDSIRLCTDDSNNYLPSNDRVLLPTRRMLETSFSVESQDAPTPMTPFAPVFHVLPEEAAQRVAYEMIVEGREGPKEKEERQAEELIAPPRRKRLSRQSSDGIKPQNSLQETSSTSQVHDYSSKTLPSARSGSSWQPKGDSQSDLRRMGASEGARMNSVGFDALAKDSGDLPTEHRDGKRLKAKIVKGSVPSTSERKHPGLVPGGTGDRRDADIASGPMSASVRDLSLAIEELDCVLDEQESSSTSPSVRTSVVEVEQECNPERSAENKKDANETGPKEAPRKEKKSVKELSKMLNINSATLMGVYGRDFKKPKAMVEKTEEGTEESEDCQEEVERVPKSVGSTEQPPSAFSKVQHVGVNLFGACDERTIADIIAQKKMRKAPPPPAPSEISRGPVRLPSSPQSSAALSPLRPPPPSARSATGSSAHSELLASRQSVSPTSPPEQSRPFANSELSSGSPPPTHGSPSAQLTRSTAPSSGTQPSAIIPPARPPAPSNSTEDVSRLQSSTSASSSVQNTREAIAVRKINDSIAVERSRHSSTSKIRRLPRLDSLDNGVSSKEPQSGRERSLSEHKTSSNDLKTPLRDKQTSRTNQKPDSCDQRVSHSSPKVQVPQMTAGINSSAGTQHRDRVLPLNDRETTKRTEGSKQAVVFRALRESESPDNSKQAAASNPCGVHRSSSVRDRISCFETFKGDRSNQEPKYRTTEFRTRQQPTLSQVNAAFSKSCDVLEKDVGSTSVGRPSRPALLSAKLLADKTSADISSRTSTNNSSSSSRREEKSSNTTTTVLEVTKVEYNAAHDQNVIKSDEKPESHGGNSNDRRKTSKSRHRSKSTDIADGKGVVSSHKKRHSGSHKVSKDGEVPKQDDSAGNASSIGVKSRNRSKSIDVVDRKDVVSSDKKRHSGSHRLSKDSEVSKQDDSAGNTDSVSSVCRSGKLRNVVRSKTCEVVTVIGQGTATANKKDVEPAVVQWRPSLDEKKDKNQMNLLIAANHMQDKHRLSGQPTESSIDSSPRDHLAKTMPDQKNSKESPPGQTIATELKNLNDAKLVANENNHTQIGSNKVKLRITQTFSSPSPRAGVRPSSGTLELWGETAKSSRTAPSRLEQTKSMIVTSSVDYSNVSDREIPCLSQSSKWTKQKEISQSSHQKESLQSADQKRLVESKTVAVSKDVSTRSNSTASSSRAAVEIGGLLAQKDTQRIGEIKKTKETKEVSDSPRTDSRMISGLKDKTGTVVPRSESEVRIRTPVDHSGNTNRSEGSSNSSPLVPSDGQLKLRTTEPPKPTPRQRSLLLQQTISKLSCQDDSSREGQSSCQIRPVPAPRRSVSQTKQVPTPRGVHVITTNTTIEDEWIRM